MWFRCCFLIESRSRQVNQVFFGLGFVDHRHFPFEVNHKLAAGDGINGVTNIENAKAQRIEIGAAHAIVDIRGNRWRVQ